MGSTTINSPISLFLTLTLVRMSRQSLFYSKEALCQELRNLMKGMWKDDGKPGYWPWITLSIAQKLNNIAVKCTGQGEQECFRWGRKYLEYFCKFNPVYFNFHDRDNDMTWKDHWMEMSERINTDEFWGQVTLPRMCNKYVERHKDGTNDYILEEWAATCQAGHRWIDPKKWQEDWWLRDFFGE